MDHMFKRINLLTSAKSKLVSSLNKAGAKMIDTSKHLNMGRVVPYKINLSHMGQEGYTMELGLPPWLHIKDKLAYLGISKSKMSTILRHHSFSQ